MKFTAFAALTASIATLGGAPALAQSQGSQVNPYDNVRAYQDYQNAKSAYDQARDASARDQSAYDQKMSAYEADRRAYERRVQDHERARADYIAKYGQDAYEAWRAPGPAPY